MTSQMHLLLALVGLATASCAATSSSKREALFPPEVAGEVWDEKLAGHREIPLWTKDALAGYQTRIRLSVSGIVLSKVAVRLDQLSDGSARGQVSFVELRSRTRILATSRRRFRVSKAEMQELNALVENAALWKSYPEFWVLKDDEAICLDGMQVILERVDARGYKFSESNAQCTTPPPIKAVAKKIIALANAKRALGWLG